MFDLFNVLDKCTKTFAFQVLIKFLIASVEFYFRLKIFTAYKKTHLHI